MTETTPDFLRKALCDRGIPQPTDEALLKLLTDWIAEGCHEDDFIGYAVEQLAPPRIVFQPNTSIYGWPITVLLTNSDTDETVQGKLIEARSPHCYLIELADGTRVEYEVNEVNDLVIKEDGTLKLWSAW